MSTKIDPGTGEQYGLKGKSHKYPQAVEPVRPNVRDERGFRLDKNGKPVQ